MMKKIKTFLGNFPKLFYAFLALVCISFVSQCLFEYAPIWRESSRIKKQEKLFRAYWEKEGIEKFKAVGLTPTEKIYQEELADYLTKYQAQNPTENPDVRVAEIKENFRRWWETTGSIEFANKNIAPTKALYNQEERKLLKAYTDKQTLYRLRLSAKEVEGGQIFLHWLLFPNLLMFFLSALSLLLFSKTLEERFGTLFPVLFFLASNALTGIFIASIGNTSFFSHADAPYTGFSAAVALFLGCAAQIRSNNQKRNAIVSVLLLASLIVSSWWTCPQIFVASIPWSIILFVGGNLLAKFFPEKKQKKTLEEKSENTDSQKESAKEKRKKETRALLDEGFSCAMRGDFALAGEKIGNSMHALLLENPPDKETIRDFAQKITNPTLFIELSSTQWLEWGTAANQKGVPEAALLFFEKALLLEKDEKVARKTKFYIGELRLLNQMNKEAGRKILEGLLEVNAEDIWGKQAQRLLEKFPNDSPQEENQ